MEPFRIICSRSLYLSVCQHHYSQEQVELLSLRCQISSLFSGVKSSSWWLFLDRDECQKDKEAFAHQWDRG